MNNEFREDSTPSIAKDEVNDEFEILLSCVGLGSAISLFHNHEVYTLEDFLSRSREEILSYNIIDNNDYDYLVDCFNEAVKVVNENENITPEKYRESIMESTYTQRFRLSISRQRTQDSYDVDSDRDSLPCDDNQHYDLHYSPVSSHKKESDYESAFRWEMSSPSSGPRVRHTVSVERSMYSPSRDFYHPVSHSIPKENDFILPPSKHQMQVLSSINEVSFCDGLTEISGGVYEDNNLSEGSVEVYLVSNGLPSSIETTNKTISIPISSRDNRQHQQTTFQVDGVIENSMNTSIINSLSQQLKSRIDRLFDGHSFSCCFYGSLLSPVSSLFYCNDYNPEESLDETFVSNSSFIQQLGEQLLDQVQEKEWRLGMSAITIQDNNVYDLLHNKDRLAVTDSGSILFIKNITCYEITKKVDIFSIIQTLNFVEPLQPLTGHMNIVFQLITPSGQYASRMALVLLAPCDKVIPVEEKQSRGMSTIQYKSNSDVTSALMTFSRVLTPGIRQPFRDNKLTLYLRPFLFRTSVILIGCLPPYQDSVSSIPESYIRRINASKPKSGLLNLGDKRRNSLNQPVKNTENFISIVRYCSTVYANNHKTVGHVMQPRKTRMVTPSPVKRTTVSLRSEPSPSKPNRVEVQNAFTASTMSISEDITELKKKINKYMNTYSRELSTSRSNKNISFDKQYDTILNMNVISMNQNASDLVILLSRLSKQ